MTLPALQNKVWLGLITAAVVGGIGTAVYFQNHNQLATAPQQSLPAIQPTETASTTTKSQPVEVYLIQAQGNKLVAVAVPIKVANSESNLKSALNAAIAPPADRPNLYSAIPPNTKILNLTVKDKDIYLDLSKEFTKGGGTASMRGRVVQVLYTATTMNTNANLYLSVEGKRISYLGGEGLEIPQPLTRSQFSLDF